MPQSEFTFLSLSHKLTLLPRPSHLSAQCPFLLKPEKNANENPVVIFGCYLPHLPHPVLFLVAKLDSQIIKDLFSLKTLVSFFIYMFWEVYNPYKGLQARDNIYNI